MSRKKATFSLVFVLGVLIAGCSAEDPGGYAEEPVQDVQEEVVEAPQPEEAEVEEPEEQSVEVFAATDLDPEVAEVTAQMLSFGVAEWGYSWPVEYWIFGVDEDAGVALIEDYCARREANGDLAYEECFESENASDTQAGYARYYLEMGQLAQSGDEWVGEAAWTSFQEWRTHIIMSSDPLGLSGYPGNAGDTDLMTVLHEYWHAVQEGSYESYDYDVRDEADGALWFSEGSAEFMSFTLFNDLQKAGSLPEVHNDYEVTMESAMEYNLELIDESLAGECSGRTLLSLDGGDECEILAYQMGAWAIAYLVDQTSDDVLLDEFYPITEELGWEAAFVEVFEMTPEAFEAEFMEFLTLPDEEKMAILDL